MDAWLGPRRPRRPRPWPRLGGLLLAAAVSTCILSSAGAYEIKAVTKPLLMLSNPCWCDETNTVTFVDMANRLVLRYDPNHPDDLKSISFPKGFGKVTSAVPVRGSSGTQLVVGVCRVLHFLDVDWGEPGPGQPAAITKDVPLIEVEVAMPDNRFSVGKADSEGRLWIGTMDGHAHAHASPSRKPNKGELFRFDLSRSAEGRVRVSASQTVAVTGNLMIPAGMAWTLDDAAYYLADAKERAVFRFDFAAAAGALSNRTAVFRFEDAGVPGVPGGVTLDRDDMLWVACSGGGRVIRVDPRSGELLATVTVSVPDVTDVEWGGEQRDVLYVTTSRHVPDDDDDDDDDDPDEDAEQDGPQPQPQAGCLFAISGLGTRGPRNAPYAVILKSASGRLMPSMLLTTLPFLLYLRQAVSSDSPPFLRRA